MKTYYVGIIVELNGEFISTEVFKTQEECEEFCLLETDDYYIVSFEIENFISSEVH